MSYVADKPIEKADEDLLGILRNNLENRFVNMIAKMVL